MKPHIKIYLDAFGHDESDWIGCERCLKTAVDVCHIEPRGMGGSKELDRIENLMAMCRDCHHYTEGILKGQLFFLHKRRLQSARVQFDETWINEMINKYGTI